MSWSFLPFNKGFKKWKSDKNSLDKVIIGLEHASFEIDEVARKSPPEHAGMLAAAKARIAGYKSDLEYRRTVAPIRRDGMSAMASDLKEIEQSLKGLGGNSLFGDDGLWGCALASSGLETMVEFDAKD